MPSDHPLKLPEPKIALTHRGAMDATRIHYRCVSHSPCPRGNLSLPLTPPLLPAGWQSLARCLVTGIAPVEPPGTAVPPARAEPAGSATLSTGRLEMGTFPEAETGLRARQIWVFPVKTSTGTSPKGFHHGIGVAGAENVSGAEFTTTPELTAPVLPALQGRVCPCLDYLYTSVLRNLILIWPQTPREAAGSVPTWCLLTPPLSPGSSRDVGAQG